MTRNVTIQTKVLPPSLRIRMGDQTPAATVRLRVPYGVLCSYPKSGNTWLRFLLSHVIRPGEIADGVDVQKTVPDIYVLKAKDLERNAFSVIKSHEAFRPDYDRVVYLYRDPRDVAVSYFHHGKATGAVDGSLSLDEYAKQFVNSEPISGSGFGNWGEHVGSWFGAKEDDPKFLPVSYEAMVSAPEAELTRIANFLEISAEPDVLATAVERASAAEMRRIEEAGNIGHKRGKQKFDENARFVRKAKAGSWRDELSPQAARRIEEAFGPLMEKLGYL